MSKDSKLASLYIPRHLIPERARVMADTLHSVPKFTRHEARLLGIGHFDSLLTVVILGYCPPLLACKDFESTAGGAPV